MFFVLTASIIWLIVSYYAFRTLSINGHLAIVLPVHTDEDIQSHLDKNWPKCWRRRRGINVYILLSRNSLANTSPLESLLKHTGCFSSVELVTVDIKPHLDRYPLGASLLFFGALSSPQIVLNNQAMFWMEPDVHFCPANRWLDPLAHTMRELKNGWMVGGVMRAHSDPLAPFYSFSEHINGNAIYNLRSESFLEFMEHVHEEFMLNGSMRFRDCFDIAIYQVAKYSLGFWRWAKIIHNFSHADFILNYYNVECGLAQVCAENPNALFVHGKKVSLKN